MKKYTYISENFTGGKGNATDSRLGRFSFPILVRGEEWECFIYEPRTEKLRSLDGVKRVFKVRSIYHAYTILFIRYFES